MAAKSMNCASVNACRYGANMSAKVSAASRGDEEWMVVKGA